MEEEIDIIELLKRVKEGKAPKKIMIGETKYEYDDTGEEIGEIYDNDYGHFLYEEEITLDTKIKILDKPIIEELPENELVGVWDVLVKVNEIIKHINLYKHIIEELDENENVDIYELARKVNQIIKHINKE